MRFGTNKLTQGLAALCVVATALGGCKDDDDTIIVQGSGWTTIYTDTGGGNGRVTENPSGTQRAISGTFLASYTMTSGVTWILDAPTIFGNDAGSVNPVLTVQAGVTVLGRGGTPPSMLVIKRGAQISAIGTAVNPIVFTSAQPVGQRAPGDWGGIVINGNATVNETNPQGEGNSGPYGGSNDADNSGTLQYVRVEYAGHIFSSSDELNGVAFQGCGTGTTVNYLQVHRNADDGVEFFGGTVNAKNLLLTGNVDDSLDWTFGWRGKVQFVVIQQYASGGDQGIEADNNGSNNSATPRSNPTISNISIIGPAGTTASSDIGILVREGTGATILNGIVQDMNQSGLDIDGAATGSTWDNVYSTNYSALSGNLIISNVIFYNNVSDFEANDSGDPATESAGNYNTDITNDGTYANNIQSGTAVLVDPTNQSTPDFRAVTGTAAMTTSWVDPNAGDAFWTTVSFLGAMDDQTANDWTQGWTTSAQN